MFKAFTLLNLTKQRRFLKFSKFFRSGSDLDLLRRSFQTQEQWWNVHQWCGFRLVFLPWYGLV